VTRPLRLATLGLALLLGACSAFKEDPTADWSASKLYSEAKDELGQKNYEQAIQYFETLEARYPFGRYAQQAQLETAYAYYKYAEMDSAVAAVDRFLRLNPRHQHVDYAYYLRGLANFNRGTSIFNLVISRDVDEMDPAPMESAFADFSKVVKEFPDSKYASDSRQRLVFLRNMLAEYELNVADFYMRRGAYVAVVNRCTHVLTRYQGSEPIPRALEMLAEAYGRLGMEELAADTRRVIEFNRSSVADSR
jgi:outer membrane protein assembly factor BamD